MFKVSRKQIDKGDFPLNHDCILKVCYISGSPIRFEYFSCRSMDSGWISELLVSTSIVKEVKFSSVDDLPDYF